MTEGEVRYGMIVIMIKIIITFESSDLAIVL